MESPSLMLHPATPTHPEATHFAKYLDIAAEGFYTTLFGKAAPTITATAFLTPGHALSHEHVIFAEQSGEIVGMTLSYTGAQNRTFTEEPLERAAGSSLRRMKFIRFLLAPLWRVLENIPEDDYYLQAVAVDPKARGTGVGSLLMDDVEARGRAAGSSRLSLHVSPKNVGARKLYARRGMIEASEWPSSRFLPSAFIYMTKEF